MFNRGLFLLNHDLTTDQPQHENLLPNIPRYAAKNSSMDMKPLGVSGVVMAADILRTIFRGSIEMGFGEIGGPSVRRGQCRAPGVLQLHAPDWGDRSLVGCHGGWHISQ